MGFDGVEICVDYAPFSQAMRGGGHEGLVADIARSVGSTFHDGKSLSFDSPDKDFRRISTMARDHGLAISSLLTISQFCDAFPMPFGVVISTTTHCMDVDPFF